MGYIFVNLSEGLGNQLFQCAAGFLQNKVNPGKIFYIFSGNRHSSTDYRTILSLEKYNSDLPEHVTKLAHGGFGTWNPRDYIYPVVYLEGCFQNYSTLKPIMPEFRTTFRNKLRAQRERMRLKYDIPESSGFIHVRRGDYVGSDVHHLQPLEYYISAHTYFPNIRQWFIFSNDMDWVKQQEFFKNLDPVFVDEEDPVLSLALMCEINGGAIIANSTFSWMGAYLAGGNVIYPTKWHGSETPDLFPESWIGIPS